MVLLSTLLISMFITMALIPILRRYAGWLHCVDVPCERNVHSVPVPKVGGISMAVGTLASVVMLVRGDRMVLSILIGAGIIVLFGFYDDLKELGYRTKFTGQMTAALVVVFFGGVKICCLGGLLPDDYLLPDWLAVPLTLLVVVGATNAVNLADGLDGLAGGLMLMCFMCIGFMAFRSGNKVILLLSVAAAGAIFGFLRFNTHPATIFMGDAGSQLLGFLAITMAISITQGNTAYSALFPLLLLGLPILDTLYVMVLRVSSGRSPFVADKNHLHHRLLQLGLFHTEAVFIMYMLQAALVTTAFLLRYYSEWAAMGVFLAFAAGAIAFQVAADKYNWRLERPGVLDWLVKIPLKKYLKDRSVMIKLSMSVIDIGLPLLLIVSCVVAGDIPHSMAWVAVGLAIAVLATSLFKSTPTVSVLRVVIYFFVPLVLYHGIVLPAGWIPTGAKYWFILSFGVVAFFAVMTLKFTQRREGFKLKPIDFIILFVAVVVPNLPDAAISLYQAGPLAAKIVVIFFVFEVLAGELRGTLGRLGFATAIALVVVAVKGFL